MRSDPASWLWRTSAPIRRDPPSSLIPSRPGTRFTSTRWAGAANRNFNNGIRLCPPARTLASSRLDNSWTASSSDDGRWYSNGAGSMRTSLKDYGRAALPDGGPIITPRYRRWEMGGAARASNRGFWLVVGLMVAASAVLLVLILLNRPAAQRASEFTARHNLRTALAAAETVRGQ